LLDSNQLIAIFTEMKLSISGLDDIVRKLTEVTGLLEKLV
jgi:hypothetical protein